MGLLELGDGDLTTADLPLVGTVKSQSPRGSPCIAGAPHLTVTVVPLHGLALAREVIPHYSKSKMTVVVSHNQHRCWAVVQHFKLPVGWSPCHLHPI